MKAEELDYDTRNDPVLAVKVATTSARENNGAEKALPENDRGEIHTRDLEPTPSPPTLVADSIERSHMIGQAAAAVAHIEDGQHVDGSNIPTNDGRKHLVSASSFPTLSPDSEHTSVVDPQPPSMPEPADRNIVGEASRSVDGDVGAEEKSSDDDYRLSFGSAESRETDGDREKGEKESGFGLEGGEEKPVNRPGGTSCGRRTTDVGER